MPITLLKITAASLCMTPTHTCAYEAPSPPIPAFITQRRPRPLEERHDRPLLLSGESNRHSPDSPRQSAAILLPLSSTFRRFVWLTSPRLSCTSCFILWFTCPTPSRPPCVVGQIQLHHVSWDMLSRPPHPRPSPVVTSVPGLGASCLRRSQCFIITDHTAAEDTIGYATYEAADHTAGEDTARRTRLMPITLLKITAASLCMTPTHTCAYEAPTPPPPPFSAGTSEGALRTSTCIYHAGTTASP